MSAGITSLVSVTVASRFRRQFDMITDIHHSSLNCDRIAVNCSLCLLHLPVHFIMCCVIIVMPFQFQHKSLVSTRAQKKTDSVSNKCLDRSRQGSILYELKLNRVITANYLFHYCRLYTYTVLMIPLFLL